MAKDKIGNDLEIGDLVLVQGILPVALTRITHISDGGIGPIITGLRKGGNERQIEAGVVICTMITQTFFDPRGDRKVPEIFKVVDADPAEAKRVIEAVKDAQKRGGGPILLQ